LDRDNKGRFVKGHIRVGESGRKKGDLLSEEHKKKIGLAHKGKTRNFTNEWKKNMSIAHMGLVVGDKHPNWKGDDVGNQALHTWVKSRLHKPKLCQICNKNPPYDLANITGIYSRRLSNWDYLCRKCHFNYDKVGTRGWITKRMGK